MVLDLDKDYITPFRVRPFTDNYHYVGVGKVIDADGYIGTFKTQPGGSQNHFNWALHEQEYLLLDLGKAVEDELMTDCFESAN
jgi:hypothetical protein